MADSKLDNDLRNLQKERQEKRMVMGSQVGISKNCWTSQKIQGHTMGTADRGDAEKAEG